MKNSVEPFNLVTPVKPSLEIYILLNLSRDSDFAVAEKKVIGLECWNSVIYGKFLKSHELTRRTRP